MLVIVQPGGEVSFGIILAFVGAFFHSLNLLTVKKLTAYETANSIIV